MNVAVLTTETLHHAYFVRELALRFPVSLAVVELSASVVPFETAHDFERRRDSFEREFFFGGAIPRIADFCPVFETESVNDPAAAEALLERKPSVLLVFGTGRIAPSLIARFPGRLLNLHGGDPEEYRGLDSHLWAIYHKDFNALVTTLHLVDERLDTGDIVRKTKIDLSACDGLHQLRARNTEACVALALSALSDLLNLRAFLTCPQKSVGRYYSSMPGNLKSICVRNFECFSAALRASEAKQ